MKWRRGEKNPDVVDQRGGGGGGGMGGMPIPSGMGKGAGGLGIIGIIIFIILQFVVGGGGGSGGFNIPTGFPSNVQPGEPQGSDPIPADQDPDAELKDFSSYVHGDVQKFWETVFQQTGEQYGRAPLVLYNGGVNTACGSATSAVGPFYCPADSSVYLDLSFYKQMAEQLMAPGDFAWAYVIAHEMGHHIQNLTGVSEKSQQEQQQAGSQEDANEISVRVELQADCYAGVWGKTVFEQGALEEGDLDEAFTATEAIGDDRLQEQSGQGIDPDSFTHGSSEQRKKWFTTGYESGSPDSCDTFSPDEV